MVQITEDYVSFETAKLLEEKGFDWDCKSKKFYPEPDYDHESPNGVYAPTLQTARKWLIENYNIHIEVRYFPMPDIYRYVIIHSPATFENIDSHPQYFNSYEEACEAAIKYCLENLI